jgi:PleD family two-component response regulator
VWELAKKAAYLHYRKEAGKLATDLRILVVDDSEAARSQLMKVLLAGGYKTVHLCHSGSEALKHLGVEPANQNPELSEPDAILLDVAMSGPDGIETCARIRADARYRYTPILIVSDETDIGTLAQAFIAGGNDYLRKPFEQLELLARLRAAMRLKSEIDRRIARERELTTVALDMDLAGHLRLLAARGADPVRKHYAAIAPYSGVLDSLTGLPGRRTVEAIIMEGPGAYLDALGVIALQIDGMPLSSTEESSKDFALFIQVANTLKALPGRLGDVLARFDGGMFTIISNEPDEKVFFDRAEALCAAISNLGLKHRPERGGGPVSLSVGAAHTEGDNADQARSLLTAAVMAMEQASSNGGNRVETNSAQTRVQLAAIAK